MLHTEVIPAIEVTAVTPAAVAAATVVMKATRAIKATAARHTAVIAVPVTAAELMILGVLIPAIAVRLHVCCLRPHLFRPLRQCLTAS